MALEQEKRVSEEIFALFELAREVKDYRAEQFLQWFVKEQVEEVALMGDLLNVVERSKENLLLAEDYIARESLGEGERRPDRAAGRWPAGREVSRADRLSARASRRRLRIALIRRNSAMSSRSAAGAGAGRKRAGSGRLDDAGLALADPVGAGAAAGGDRRGRALAFPEQAGVVVEAVAAGHAVADRVEVGGAALGLVVVVDAEAAAGAGRGRPRPAGLPEDLVMPASNQHIAPALWPARTMPWRQARLRMALRSCASQTASRLTRLPPPT